MLDEMKRSNLRGRGGAGFPIGTKWEGARNAPGAERYIVCNADEGEPGTFKDRVLLNSFSVRVLEGMAIAGYVAGATKGFIYLRGEYKHLQAKLQREIDEMRAERAARRLDPRRAGLRFRHRDPYGRGRLHLRRRHGDGRIRSKASRAGRACGRRRWCRSATSASRRWSTTSNRSPTRPRSPIEGGARFAKRGTRFSTGTKLISISGDCERPGVYEYQFGVTIGRVLEDCGAKAVSAVQIGGASGVLVTPDEFSRRIAFEDVPTAGAFMVFGADRDIFEVARNFAHFFAHESCGFCTPCRVGTTIQRNIMDKIAEGRGVALRGQRAEARGRVHEAHQPLRPRRNGRQRGARRAQQVQAGVRAAAARARISRRRSISNGRSSRRGGSPARDDAEAHLETEG